MTRTHVNSALRMNDNFDKINFVEIFYTKGRNRGDGITKRPSLKARFRKYCTRTSDAYNPGGLRAIFYFYVPNS